MEALSRAGPGQASHAHGARDLAVEVQKVRRAENASDV